MNLLSELIHYVLTTVIRFFPILLLGATLAAFIQVYVDPEKMKAWLTRRSAISVPATVAFGAFTPFCACGTMAVIVGMLATTMPWAPIMAFLTSSPLMSPTNFVLLYGVVSPEFAVATAVASVLIGLAAGYITLFIERRSLFLADQLRFSAGQTKRGARCGCSENIAEASCFSDPTQAETSAESYCEILTDPIAAKPFITSHPRGCAISQSNASSCHASAAVAETGRSGTTAAQTAPNQSVMQRFPDMIRAIFQISVIRILPIFTIFTAAGFLVNRLVPSSVFTNLLGSQSLIGVPLATLIGLPLYVSGESAVPLIRSLLDAGVSPGTMLAFMIAGPGTSAAAIAGIGAIMKPRAIALYIAYILGAALLFGYGYDAILRIAPL
jgi:uncharacterized protein